MYKIPILSAIFQGIPESMALVFLTMVLLKARINWKTILALGVIQTALAFLIRMLPFAFGVHTVLLILSISLMVAYVTKNEIIRVVPAAISSLIVLIAFEFIGMKFITTVFSIGIEKIVAEPLFRIMAGIPQIILMFITGFIILFIRKRRKI